MYIHKTNMFHFYTRLQTATLFSICLASNGFDLDMGIDYLLQPNGTMISKGKQSTTSNELYPGVDENDHFLHRRMNSEDVKKKLDKFTMSKSNSYIPFSLPNNDKDIDNGIMKYETEALKLRTPGPELNAVALAVISDSDYEKEIYKEFKTEPVVPVKAIHAVPDHSAEAIHTAYRYDQNQKIIDEDTLSSIEYEEYENQKQHNNVTEMHPHNYTASIKEVVNIDGEFLRNMDSIEPLSYTTNTWILDPESRDTPSGLVSNCMPSRKAITGRRYSINPRYAIRNREVDYTDPKAKYLKIMERENLIIDILKKQTLLLQQVAQSIDAKYTKGSIRSKNDFNDLITEIDKKNMEKAKINKTNVTVKPKDTVSKVLPTVNTIIDETEVRRALRRDPYVQRILKMAKRKRDLYIKEAKKFFR